MPAQVLALHSWETTKCSNLQLKKLGVRRLVLAQNKTFALYGWEKKQGVRTPLLGRNRVFASYYWDKTRYSPSIAGTKLGVRPASLDKTRCLPSIVRTEQGVRPLLLGQN